MQLEAELTCTICLGLLCRPHVIPCGHTFCGACIFDHDRLSVAEQIACPSCRQPLPRSAPALQRQLNSYLDRVREALPTEEVCSESLEDYLARRRAWDERSTISRAAWTGHRHSGADDGSDGRQQRRPQDQQMSTLHIKVVNHTSYGTHPEVYFRLLATTPFGRLTTAYCQRQNLERRHVCFKFNGVLIRDVQTPESLNMTDGDVLEAFWLPTLQANQRASRLSTLRSRRAE